MPLRLLFSYVRPPLCSLANNIKCPEGSDISTLLILHTIHAKAHRSFSIRGTVPISSNADISIEDLDDKPREFLTRNGQIAHRFKITQNMIINGIAWKMGSRGGAKGPAEK
jgi:hypothetical protein